MTVTLLMATHNGAAHLPAQLASIAAQSHGDWQLWVSDDGSTDDTRALIEDFARTHPVHLIEGPRAGAAANFMHLLCHPDLPAGPVALSDQDDIWLPGKLARALAALQDVHGPALYGAQSLHVDATGTPLGPSPATPRGPSFENALVQNVVSGHSAVLNAQGLALVRRAGMPARIAFHDWWLYALMTGAGGRIILDPEQVLHYRQHGANVMGSFRGLRARMARLGLMLRGDFGRWMAANRAGLRATDVLTPEARAALRAIDQSCPGPARAATLRRLGVHRQGRVDTAAVMIAAALGRI